ncbi:MAG TPA: transglycosylase family protein [Methylomirabilota bacterium]|nr:transglycosylase family protein [Methylomirabilota bacterium]
MLKKLTEYCLLVIISFCFFTVCFHAVARADTISGNHFLLTDQTITPEPTPKPPFHSFTVPTPTPPSDPSPTPTPTNLPTPTATPTPTTLPTTTPTATPTPTVTPTPTLTDTPPPTPTVSPTTDLESLFIHYSNQYSVDKNELEKIAQCESDKNTNSAGNPPYLGMFQFSPTSWNNVRTQMNLDPNPDLRTNADEAIKTAAYMLSRGQQSAWPNCN